MGDPSKNLFLTEVLNVIRRENLLEEVTRSGKTLLQGLYALQVCVRGRTLPHVSIPTAVTLLSGKLVEHTSDNKQTKALPLHLILSTANINFNNILSLVTLVKAHQATI